MNRLRRFAWRIVLFARPTTQSVLRQVALALIHAPEILADLLGLQASDDYRLEEIAPQKRKEQQSEDLARSNNRTD